MEDVSERAASRVGENRAGQDQDTKPAAMDRRRGGGVRRFGPSGHCRGSVSCARRVDSSRHRLTRDDWSVDRSGFPIHRRCRVDTPDHVVAQCGWTGGSAGDVSALARRYRSARLRSLARRRGEQCCKASCSRRTGDFVGVSNPPPNVGARPATARYVRGHGFRRRPATHRPGRCCSSAAIRPRSSGTGSPSDGGHTAGKIVNLSVARQGSGGRTREIRENYAGSFLPRKWPGRDAVQTIMLT